jgi:hypothetical protein
MRRHRGAPMVQPYRFAQYCGSLLAKIVVARHENVAASGDSDA